MAVSRYFDDQVYGMPSRPGCIACLLAINHNGNSKIDSQSEFLGFDTLNAVNDNNYPNQIIFANSREVA